MQNESMKAQAWINSQAIGNVLSGAFGGKALSFDELFPKEVKKNPGQVDINNLEEIAAACSKHGITPPTE